MAEPSQALNEARSVVQTKTAGESEAQVDGAVASALVSAGVGSAVLGIVTVLAAASQTFSSGLAWVAPVGPLSGKTTVAVVAWLLSWAWLARRWRERDLDFGRVAAWTAVLIALGFLGTFPPVFEIFE